MSICWCNFKWVHHANSAVKELDLNAGDEAVQGDDEKWRAVDLCSGRGKQRHARPGQSSGLSLAV